MPAFAALVLAAAVLAGCKGTTTRGPDRTVIVTVPASTSATPTDTGSQTLSTPSATTSSNGPAVSSTSSKPASGPASISPSVPKTSARLSTKATKQLPGSCGSLLPRTRVAAALGGKVTGTTTFVVGLPDTTISRLSYINCRYGGLGNRPNIEIQVSLYSSVAKASARIAPNVADFTAHNATAARTTVEGVRATLLVGGNGVGYDPTLIMAVGSRTIAVSIASGVVPKPQQTSALVALGALAAERTG